MSWLGKILGGGLGFVLGGPIGAVLGAVLGHTTLDGRGGGVNFGFSRLEQKQSIYFTAVFSMLGKLAKADGVVTQQEVDLIDRMMTENFKLTPQARQLAIRIFNAAKDSPQDFDDFARQLAEEFSDSPEVLASVIELLMMVAHADGDIHAVEERMILGAVKLFGVDEAYRQIRGRLTGVPDDVERYYTILGSARGDDLTVIKKRYRKLAMEYHPDRIQSRGMAPEFATAAEEKFKEIQHAFDIVERDLANR
ncbi:MAG: TerB family tellurite resistance protein [Pseudomonadota bacterium]